MARSRIGFRIVLAAFAVAAAHPAAEPGVQSQETTPEPETSKTRVVMLGTGTPNPDPERSGPSVAVVVDDLALLVDAGPGVVRRASAAQAKGVEALRVANLDRVFLTHLHSDHTLGLPDLIFSPWVLERDRPLEIWGPPGTAEMVEHIQAAWRQDVHMRLFGLEPANTRGHRTVVHELEGGGVAFVDRQVKVEAIEVDHGSWPVAFAYRFTTADKRILISGDTALSEHLEAAASDLDLLVHEVYSVSGFARRKPEWQRYHAANHTSAHELGELAARVEPGRLVLYHWIPCPWRPLASGSYDSIGPVPPSQTF